jgi:hypothetical protein
MYFRYCISCDCKAPRAWLPRSSCFTPLDFYLWGTIPCKALCVCCYIMTVPNTVHFLWINLYKFSKLWSSFWNILYFMMQIFRVNIWYLPNLRKTACANMCVCVCVLKISNQVLNFNESLYETHDCISLRLHNVNSLPPTIPTQNTTRAARGRSEM